MGMWLLGKLWSLCEVHCAKVGSETWDFCLSLGKYSLRGLHRPTVIAHWCPGCPWALLHPPRGMVPARLAARGGNSPPTFLRCLLPGPVSAAYRLYK